ncbi:PDZ and LIM domain protein 7 isoform X1 [Chiloscyllium plagiosum]|uniref:PDZ and LIM domain protein 7 isoform X1 n=2 Tax=Chiloscyllium plagiosum TaxID=36176 RepID=UPI001CB827CB|nr:PDZ and LIM domain protein 7 isoform X1 [Chiloscyllium plagiosum]XP_043559656.1 PDZ and LIM domain protein 7 isoform X1 [Chiloscyllium plagiosum]
MELYKVTLEGPAPWGFRLQGGKDFNKPLTMSRITPGSKADLANIGLGDMVLSINGENTEGMTHLEAQSKIKSCVGFLTLSLGKVVRSTGGGDEKDFMLTEPSVPKYSFDSNMPLNKTARPFGVTTTGSSNSGTPIKSVSYKPVSLYTPPSALPSITPASQTQLQYGTTTEKHSSTATTLQHPNGPETGAAGRSFDLASALEPSSKSDEDSEKNVPCAPAHSSGPSCRPPWVVDTSFAEKYAPDKTTTIMTKFTQPAQPTPQQNRNSIVQAAQQAPDGTNRTPVCAHCNKVIKGRYLVALGRSWHPEEFTCNQCKMTLTEGGFFEEKGSVFCGKCYENKHAPNCAKCKQKIVGEIMHALKQTWHVKCFNCTACKNPIRNKAFYMEEGQPYCERDYEKMFGTKCHGCDFKIDAGDRFLEALGYSWHDTCFVCAVCHINLEGKTFYSKKEKPLCKSHAFSTI